LQRESLGRLVVSLAHSKSRKACGLDGGHHPGTASEGYLMPGRLGCVSKGYKGIKVATATNKAKQNAHSQYTGWIWIWIVANLQIDERCCVPLIHLLV
jgi:hypothetical protein